MKQITIGRSPDNDIVIDDSSVSRHHATIIQTVNGIVVSDNGSSNGTFINGNRIHEETTLRNNDILKLGTALVPWRNYFENATNHDEVKTRIVSEDSNESKRSEKNKSSSTNAIQNKIVSTPRKSKKGLVIGLTAAAILILVFIALNLNKNSSSDYNSRYAEPVVISESIEFIERGILNKTLIGHVTVTNKSNFGGDIEVIATCEQEGESYDQSKTIYLNPGQTITLDFEFREVKRLKYEPNFSAIALALNM